MDPSRRGGRGGTRPERVARPAGELRPENRSPELRKWKKKLKSGAREVPGRFPPPLRAIKEPGRPPHSPRHVTVRVRDGAPSRAADGRTVGLLCLWVSGWLPPLSPVGRGEPGIGGPPGPAGIREREADPGRDGRRVPALVKPGGRGRSPSRSRAFPSFPPLKNPPEGLSNSSHPEYMRTVRTVLRVGSGDPGRGASPGLVGRPLPLGTTWSSLHNH